MTTWSDTFKVHIPTRAKWLVSAKINEDEAVNKDDAKSTTPQSAPWKPREIPPTPPLGVDRDAESEAFNTGPFKTDVLDITNVDERDERGWTRLHWAVFDRDVSRVRDLLAMGAMQDPCYAGRTSYDFAVMFASGWDIQNLLQGVAESI